MGILTPFFNLFKPAKTDPLAVAKINEDLDIIDTELHRPPLTVNEIAPDASTRNLRLETVPLADNLTSNDAQLITGDFIERASGGDASIADGDASLVSVKGNMVKTGYIPEEIDMTVSPAERAEGVDPITATINRDTFVAYVPDTTTITLTFTTSWSANPATYGITVTGTPVSGDVITVDYVKENRGTITPANPTAFVSTGWNLFDRTAGYAKVVKYSDDYNFLVGGSYSLLEFSTTPTGTRTGLTVVDGLFTIPSDGYVFVTNSNADTYILMTWSDWTEGYEGTFQSYTDDTIDLSEAMLNFPYGLLAVGTVRDEINLNSQRAINRVERIAYTAENLAAVVASGVAYDTDTNYIYAALETPISTVISIDGTYTVSSHGIEYFANTSVDVYTEILYGNNLKDKLTRDVLTISAQELTAYQQAQVQQNISVPSKTEFNTLKDRVGYIPSTTVTSLSDIPVNSQGRVTLAAAISPTGESLSVNYQCYGNDTRRTITATNVAGNADYATYYNGTSWSVWKSEQIYTIGDAIDLPGMVIGYAYSTSVLRCIIYVPKEIANSGIAFSSNFSVSEIRDMSGSSVSISGVSISGASRFGKRNLQIDISGITLTQNATYRMMVGGNRRVDVVAPTT